MERKCYQAPRAEVNLIGQEQIICGTGGGGGGSTPSSRVKNISTNLTGDNALKIGGAGSSDIAARVNQRGGIFGEAAEGGSIW